MSLRARFLLIVVLASVIPLALVGLWLTGSARRSGEDLLRERMGMALDEAVSVVTSQWIRHRSSLLFVAESPDVQSVLGSDSRVPEANAVSLETRFPSLDPAVLGIDVLAPDGSIVERMERQPPGASSPWLAQDGTLLLLDVPVFERASGRHLGTLRVAMEPGLLLPPGRVPATAAGTFITLVDGSGRALMPVPIQLPEGSADSFDWAGEEWMAVRRELEEPAVSLVAAATLGPALGPFQRTARQGTLVLVAVALLAVASTGLLTGRMTRSLRTLSEAADAVAQGDLARRISVESEDEVGRVATAFNLMTERLRRTLDRMAGRESLAAVGEFAAGLAHEVRNPLTSVQIDMQFVESELPPGSPLLEAQQKALAEIRRLDSTVRDALRVARSGRVELRTIDLRDSLEAAGEAARPTFDARGAVLRVDLPEEPVEIEGEPGALEQLFLNLMQNAGEALPQGGEATVLVAVDGPDVSVHIVDDGPGIAPDVLQHAFEPLFSTRAEGTGLGLPIAQRIALAHEGTIHIETEPGEGTTVEVRLPSSVSGIGPQAPGVRAAP
jgi:signal transduction histidine kinase